MRPDAITTLADSTASITPIVGSLCRCHYICHANPTGNNLHHPQDLDTSPSWALPTTLRNHATSSASSCRRCLPLSLLCQVQLPSPSRALQCQHCWQCHFCCQGANGSCPIEQTSWHKLVGILAKISFTPEDDTSAPLGPDEVKWIQGIIGFLLYDCHAVDNKLLVALSTIGSQ